MKSNTKIQKSTRTQTITRTDWMTAPTIGYPKTTTSSSSFPVTSEVRQLVAGTQGRGNFISPVGQNYQVSYTSYYAGTVNIISQNQSAGSGYYSTNTTVGPTGSGVAVVALPVDGDLVNNRAIGKLATAARGSLDLSVDLAESSQTKAMLTKIGRMETYINDFRGKHKTIANRYLEFIFGWKPLVQSLFDTVAEVNNALPSAQRIIRRASSTVSNSVTTVGTSFSTTVNYSSVYRVEYGFVFTPINATLNQIARVTSLNPASIAWELMPYSFLIDYAVDIGSYLRNMETAILHAGAISYGWKTITVRHRAYGVSTGRGTAPYLGGPITTGTLRSESYTQSKIRAPIAAWPLPTKPKFNLRLGATRLLNVAALLTQLLPSPGKSTAAKKRRPVSKLVLAKRRKAKDRLMRMTQVTINTGPKPDSNKRYPFHASRTNRHS